MISIWSIPNISWRAFRVWQRNFIVWLKYFKSSLIGGLGEPILFLLAIGYGLGKFVPNIEGMSYMQFIAPGILASGTMYSASFECTFGSYTRMTTQKTFQAIVMTPINIDEVVAGDILWGATQGLISGMIMFVVIFVFNLLPSVFSLGVPIILAIQGLLFASLSMLFTAWSPSYQFFNYYFTLILAPMFLFSGIFFPLSSMPKWVQIMAWFMPLTHVVDLVRDLVLGNIRFTLIYDIIWIAIFTAVTSFFAINFMKKRLIK